jgi:hypothetical protein
MLIHRRVAKGDGRAREGVNRSIGKGVGGFDEPVLFYGIDASEQFA